MAEKVVDLGQGIELWKVNVDELIEQDVNARTMRKEAFDRLTATIKRDSRVESLPFCAMTEKGLEIISGHHRVRAMRTAGVVETYVLVDVTGLDRSAIAAKQLAHNAIQGFDDPQLLARIYEQIDDVDARLESFIDPETLQVELPTIKVDDIDLGMHFESVIVMFIPWEKEYVRETVSVIERELAGTHIKEAWLAELGWWDEFRKVGNQITREYDIHTMSTALYQMAALARQQLGEDPPDDAERIALRDLLGTFFIPTEAAQVIKAAIERMTAAGSISERAPWRALELWAADYLAGPEVENDRPA